MRPLQGKLYLNHGPLLFIALLFAVLLNYELWIDLLFHVSRGHLSSLSSSSLSTRSRTSHYPFMNIFVAATLGGDDDSASQTQRPLSAERVAHLRRNLLEKQLRKLAPDLNTETLQSLLSLPNPPPVEQVEMDGEENTTMTTTATTTTDQDLQFKQYLVDALEEAAKIRHVPPPPPSINATTESGDSPQVLFGNNNTDLVFQDRDYARLSLECYCKSKPRVIQFGDTDRKACLNEWIFVTQVDYSKFLYDVAVKIYVNKCKRELVVSFRGSQAVYDWVKNLEATKTACPWSSLDFRCGSIHLGFWRYYNVVRLSLFAKIGAYISPFSPYFYVRHITVVGHSLGGAMATLHSFELMYAMRHNLFSFFSQVESIGVRTFGSPKVGDALFTTAFNDLTQTSRRYVNHLGETEDVDFVTTMPPDMLGFKHVDQDVALSCTLNSSLKCHSITFAYLPEFDPYADQTLENFLKESTNSC